MRRSLLTKNSQMQSEQFSKTSDKAFKGPLRIEHNILSIEGNLKLS